MLPSKSQIYNEKNQLFSQNIFLQNLYFSKRKRFLEKYIFSDFRGSSRHVDYLFTCLDPIVKLSINYLQHHVEFTKNHENYVNFKF